MATSNDDYQIPDDWRGKMISRIRELMKEADPEIIEEVKYKTASNPNGVLVWYCDGMISTGEVYKQHLRLGFSKGVILKENDPKGLFNAYRAILIHEEDKLDEAAFKEIVRAAVSLNKEAKSKKLASKKKK